MKKDTPKYIQIADYIHQNIVEDNYKCGEKLPSESELLEMFSVSRIVVVNALKKLMSEGIIYRVAGKGSFVNQKQPLLLKNSNNESNKYAHVFFVISGIIDQYSQTLASEIANECYKRNIHCSINFSFNNNKIEAEIIDYAIKSGISGIILFPCDKEVYSYSLLTAIDKNIPVVLVDHELPGLGLSCVSTDNVQATQLATSHLIDLGHEKICLFSRIPMPTMSITERTNGFILEMKTRNKLIDPSLILTNATDEILNSELDNVIKNKLASAFLCLSITDFQTVNDAIRNHGYKCPDDFSIIHFDSIFNISIPDTHTTHIMQDSKKISFETIEILHDILTAKENVCKKVTIMPIFVNGNTTKKLE